MLNKKSKTEESLENFNNWINSNQLTKKEKQELINLKNSEKKINELFNNNPIKFGTAGIRKKTGLGTQKLNRFTYRLLSVGYAEYLKNKHKNLNASVLIIHDNRINGYKYCLEIASILKQQKIKVYLSPRNKPLPTPILSYLIKKLNLQGGINITASHNPPEYNGFKVYDSTGKQLNKKEEQTFIKNIPSLNKAIEIPDYLNSNKKNKIIFKQIPESLIEKYFQEIEKNISNLIDHKNKINKEIPVLFSGHQGTTKKLMKNMAYRLGFYKFKEQKTECLKEKNWNPEEIKSFEKLKEEAEKTKTNYICASDPDGDRAAIAERQKDGSWYFFNGNEIGILMSHFKYLLMKEKNLYIVNSFVTNTFLEIMFPNIPIYKTDTGFKNISEKVEQEETKGNNLLIAFEEAIGVLLFPFNREKDSFQQISFLLILIAVLKTTNSNLIPENTTTMKEYLNFLFQKYGNWCGFTDFYMTTNKDPIKKIKNLNMEDIKKITKNKIKSIKFDEKLNILSWILELDNKESWIKFRNSGTEPKIKAYYNIFYDKKNKGYIDNLIEQIKTFLLQIFREN